MNFLALIRRSKDWLRVFRARGSVALNVKLDSPPLNVKLDFSSPDKCWMRQELNTVGKRSGNSGKIAIVGMASHFPEATSLYDFWTNVRDGRDSISENVGLKGYWDQKDFYEYKSKDPEKVYANRAGWVPPIDFDPVDFKIPPNMLESISTAQLFALHVAKQALEDAGLCGSGDWSVDRQKIGVILGGAGNGNTSFMLAARQQAPIVRKILANTGLPDYWISDVVDRLLSQYQEWNEDSFPGFLGNVACGRISSYFDLGGTSNMVDAACASSLAAMKAAIGELNDGSCDAVLTGGVNLENSIFSFLCFSRTPALSPTNTSRPFDEKSDGMLLGDGVGLLVLKRLEDAERAGDRVYAVIRSLSGSSDGRAKSIFAPRAEGQVLALQRAYRAAGVDPVTIGLIEAHGTGTVSGDQTEISSLKKVFGDQPFVPQSVALGSIKSQIGHTRCSAGAASAIKVALSLYHKVLPPTINVESPNPILGLEESPFYLNTESRPWLRREDGEPRRAGVSAFGFGGTNYHVVLEEYESDHKKPYRLDRPAEILLITAANPLCLCKTIEGVLAEISGESGEFAYKLFLREQSSREMESGTANLVLVATDLIEARAHLNTSLDLLKERKEEPWDHPAGIHYRPTTPTPGGIVALFPGQGSQYVGMARDVANEFPEMRNAIEAFDKACVSEGQEKISAAILPTHAFSEAERTANQHKLTSTENAQPGIGAVSLGYFKILKNIGFKPEFAAGHSYGELVALYAADVLNIEDFSRLSVVRGQLMKACNSEADAGAMLAVALGEHDISPWLKEVPGVAIANINSCSQVVLGGSSEDITSVQQALNARKVRCFRLPVSAAFHTAYVNSALQPFKEYLKSIEFEKASLKVYSNRSANEYPDKTEEKYDALSMQIVSQVKFKDQIENIYNAGGRLFVEIGPKGILSGIVSEVLGDRQHATVTLNPSESIDSGLQLRKAIAKLIAEGVKLDFNYDRHRIVEPVGAAKGALVFEVNGGRFLTEQSRIKSEQGLRVDHESAERFKRELLEDASEYAKVSANAAESVSVNASQVMSSVAHVAPDDECDQSKSNKQPINKPAAPKSKPTPDLEKAVKNAAYSRSEHTMLPNDKWKPSMNEHGREQEPGRSSRAFNRQADASQRVNEVHSLFQENQKDYIQLLHKVVDKQFELFDRHAKEPAFNEMVLSLKQSLDLLERNQQCYHANHGSYFNNQALLLGDSSSRPDLTSTESFATASEGRVSSNGTVNQVAVGANATEQGNTELVNGALSDAQRSSGYSGADGQYARRSVQTSFDAPQRSADHSATGLNGENNAQRTNNGSSHEQAQQLNTLSAPRAELPGMPDSVSGAAFVDSEGSTQSAATNTVNTTRTQLNADAYEQTQEDIKVLKQLDGITAEFLQGELIRIIGDKTGYPEDMIGVDMDLEADLGIDSIKRIEIIGAMFDEFFSSNMFVSNSEEYAELETFDVEQFSSISKMVNFMIEFIEEFRKHLRSGGGIKNFKSAADGEPIVEPEVQPVGVQAQRATVSPPPIAPGRIPNSATDNSVDQDVASVMSSIGFMTSTADLDDALENASADDSPRAVEEGAIATSANRVESKKKAQHTTRALVAHDEDGSLGRYQVVAQSLPLPDSARLQLSAGSIWLIVSETDVKCESAAQCLAGTGAGVVRLTLNGDLPLASDLWHTCTVDGSNESALSSAIISLVKSYGAIGGMVYLQPSSENPETLSACFSAEGYVSAERIFGLVKQIGQHCVNTDEGSSLEHFMIVSRLDGVLGTSESSHYDLVTSGCTGIVKSLALEWSQVKCKAVDVAPEISEKEVAEIIFQELCDPDTRIKEVGRKDTQSRMTLSLKKTELKDDVLSPFDRKDVFLVSGGGLGITASCIIELSKQSGASFALLGRTPIEAELPKWAQGANDENTLKAAAIEQMTSAGLQPTPVKIELMVSPLRKAAEIRKTLEAIKHAGGHADYYTCDVQDSQAVAQCVEQITERFGKVTGLVHGAGNLADRKIEKKTMDDFSSVFHTKVRGLENLINAVSTKELKLLCLFSSVSGYFGNAGQVDYAMANEVFNKVAHVCGGSESIQIVKSINWGPWDSGMVSTTLKKAYRDWGIAIIPTGDGAQRFCSEINGEKCAQVVVGSSVYHQPSAIPSKVVPTSFQRHISVADNPFLMDHAVDGKAILPVTFALSWMIETAKYLVPGHRLSVATELRVSNGLSLDAATKHDCEVELVPIEHVGDTVMMKASVFTTLNNAVREHYSCLLEMSPSLVGTDEKPVSMDWNATDVLENWNLYKGKYLPGLLFSGPSLQGIERIVSNETEGITALCRLNTVERSFLGKFYFTGFNPMIADVALQAPYGWIILNTRTGGLPSSIGQVEQFAEIGFDEAFSVTACVVNKSDTRIEFDIVVRNSDGDMCCRLSKVQFTVSKSIRAKVLRNAELESA